jgi:hypothetical protein
VIALDPCPFEQKYCGAFKLNQGLVRLEDERSANERAYSRDFSSASAPSDEPVALWFYPEDVISISIDLNVFASIPVIVFEWNAFARQSNSVNATLVARDALSNQLSQSSSFPTSPVDQWSKQYVSSNRFNSLEIVTNVARLGLRNIEFIYPTGDMSWSICSSQLEWLCAFNLNRLRHPLTVFRPSTDPNSPFAVDHSTGTAEGAFLSSASDCSTETLEYSMPIHPNVSGQPTWFEVTAWIARKATDSDRADSIEIYLVDKDKRKRLQVLHSNQLPRSLHFVNPFRLDQLVPLVWQPLRSWFLISGRSELRLRWSITGQAPHLALDDLTVFPVSKEVSQPIGYCSFERDLCNFQPVPNRHNSFLIGRATVDYPAVFGAKLKPLTNTNFHFLYVDLNTLKVAQEEPTDQELGVHLLSSYFYPPTSGRMCLTVKVNSVFADPTSTGSLHVFRLDDDDQYEQLFTVNRELNDWIECKISLTFNRPFRIVLSATTSNSTRSALFALSHFWLRSGDCLSAKQHALTGQNEQISCDFDNDMCGWRNQASNQWSQMANDDSTTETESVCSESCILLQKKPKSDSDEPIESIEAELRSPIFSLDGSLLNFCLQITFYKDLGSNWGEIEVKVDGEETIFESSQSMVQQKWIIKQVSFFPRPQFYLLLIGRSSGGTLAVQSVQVTYGACSKLILSLIDLDCSFEFDTCDFGPVEGHDTFARITGKSLDSGTFGDHTFKLGTGHVFGLQLAEDNTIEEARTQLPPLSYQKDSCLRFWINSNIPVHVRIQDGDRVVFDQSVQNGFGLWFGYEIQLNESENTHQIARFTLIVKHEARLAGHVVFDDFYGYEGRCGGHFCSFDGLPCLWEFRKGEQQLSESQVTLNDTVSSISAELHYPYQDHTTRSKYGKVLFNTISSAYFMMQSPLYQVDVTSQDPDPIFCFQAFYHLPIAFQTTLTLCVATNQLTTVKQVSKQNLSQGSYWNPISINIPVNRLGPSAANQSGPNGQIEFYVALFISPQAQDTYMLMDDVSVSPGQCPKHPSQFECGPQTVLLQHVCDQRQQCSDGSDERYCGNCLFSEVISNAAKSNSNSMDLTSDQLSDSILSQACRYEIRSTSQTHTSISSTAKMQRMHPNLLMPSDLGWLWVAAVKSDEQFEVVQLFSPFVRRTNVNCALRFKMATIRARLSVWAELERLSERIELWTSNTSKQDQFDTFSIPIDGIREPFRLMFVIQPDRYNRIPPRDLVSNDGKPLDARWSQVLIQSIEVVDCTSKAPTFNEHEHIYEARDVLGLSMHSGTFKCTNKMRIESSKMCDFHNDCDDNSDEMNCSYDHYRSNFYLKETPFNWNGKWSREPTAAQLSSGPTTDRSSNDFLGYFFILRNQKKASKFGRQITSGNLMGFEMHNRDKCTMRFVYQARARQPIRMSFLWRSMTLENKHDVKVLLLPEVDRWTMVTVPFDSSQVGPLFSLKVHVRLLPDDDFFAIDDISFTTDCYGRRELSIDCRFALITMCMWRTEKPVKPKIESEQSMSNSMTIEPTESYGKAIDEFRVKPMVRFRGKSRFCTARPSSYLTQKQFYAFTFGPSDLCDSNSSAPMSKYRTSLYEQSWLQSFRLISPPFVVRDRPNGSITFSYLVYGCHFAQLQLVDRVSGETLLQVQSSSLSDQWLTQDIPIQKRVGLPMNLAIDLRIVGGNSYVALDKMLFQIRNSDQQTIERCTFDLKSNCDLLDKHQLFGYEWTYSFDRPLPVADQTLGSTYGSFIYATSEVPDMKRLWLKVKDKDEFCVSFWHTSFALDRQTHQINRFSKSIPFELSFGTDWPAEYKQLFRSRVNLKGEWRQARINLKVIRGEGIRFKAKFLKAIDHQQDQFVIAIDQIEIESNCRVGTCWIGAEKCDWRNSNEPNTVQWAQIDPLTCEAERYRICAKVFERFREILIVDFGSGDRRNRREADLISSELSSSSSHVSCLRISYAFEYKTAISLVILLNDGIQERVVASFRPVLPDGWTVWRTALIQFSTESETGAQELRVRAQLGMSLPVSSDRLEAVVAISELVYSQGECLESKQTDGLFETEVVLQATNRPSLNSSYQTYARPEGNAWNVSIWKISASINLLIVYFAFLAWKKGRSR